jgi:hypothetical protein
MKTVEKRWLRMPEIGTVMLAGFGMARFIVV